MHIDILPAVLEDKIIIRNLLELCQYDYSEFNAEDMNEHGLFDYPYLDNYWTEETRKPYLVRIDGKLAGLVLVCQTEDDRGTWVNSISEFFILRKYRHQGIGKQVAFWTFNRYPGTWRVAQEKNNLSAQTFWRKIISQYTRGKFQETQDTTWDGPVQTFCSNNNR